MALLFRCVVGGIIVSLFAILGDLIKPKSLGGTTAAAPAVALATMWLTIRKEGPTYTALEARSMIAGAMAYLVFAVAVSYVQMHYKPKALITATTMLPVWGVVAAVLWAVWLRR